MQIKFDPTGKGISSKYEVVLDTDSSKYKKELARLNNFYDSSELTNILIGDLSEIDLNGEEPFDKIEKYIKNYVKDCYKFSEIQSEKYALFMREHLEKDFKKQNKDNDLRLQFYVMYKDVYSIFKKKKEIEKFVLLLDNYFEGKLVFNTEDSFEIGNYVYVSPIISFKTKVV